MSVGRDPVDRVIDLAVAVPLCTALAVRGLVPVVARAGERAATGLLESILHMRREPVPDRPPRVEDGPANHAGEAETPVEARPDLPIPGYDSLAAQQVCHRLPELTADQLSSVERYEVANRRRRVVLGKIEQLTS